MPFLCAILLLLLLRLGRRLLARRLLGRRGRLLVGSRGRPHRRLFCGGLGRFVLRGRLLRCSSRLPLIAGPLVDPRLPPRPVLPGPCLPRRGGPLRPRRPRGAPRRSLRPPPPRLPRP